MCDMCSPGNDRWTTPPGTPERMAEIEAHQRETILNEGHQVMGIFGDPTTGAPAFFYTAGRALFGKPELLMVGNLNPKVGQFVLNEACRLIDEGEIVLDKHGTVEVPADTLLANFPCRIAPCDPVASSMTAAVRLVNGNLEAYQVIWPDFNGRFPDDPMYDQTCKQTLYT